MHASTSSLFECATLTSVEPSGLVKIYLTRTAQKHAFTVVWFERFLIGLLKFK